jgi:predicted alpha/beta superfamily hydrolase
MTSKVWLTAFLLMPAILVATLMYTIGGPRQMNERPIGAGAGATGGANAIGELLAGNRANHNAASSTFPELRRADRATLEAQPASSKAGEPTLVQPEELPQGFVVIVEDKSKLASEASPIYFASSINGWNPRDEKYRLTAQSDGKWRIILPAKPGGGLIEFKFTRGSWTNEELDANLSSIANRYFPKVDVSKLTPGEQPRVEFVVPAWGDQRAEDPVLKAKDPYRVLNVTGTVRRLQVRGGAGGAENSFRDLLIWLPPGYDAPENANVSYPVLYMQDGQNLFEKMPGTGGEWGADEAATKLITSGETQPFIIVGIPHSEALRISEYLPVEALDNVKPGADAYVDFVVKDVMPRVARTFRVKSGPTNTGIGGSSLGAAVALHAATTRPDVFGLLLAESLPLATGNASAWDTYITSIRAFPSRAYIGVGGHELGQDEKNKDRNAQYASVSRKLDDLFAKAGLDRAHRMLVVDDAAEHTEGAWAKRLPEALKFLFPQSMDGAVK